ncbi:hypothetical protein R0131_13305 [Clostridium sp. AL.422]|uniref:hypothetical protein n=1 Tax=Clostridium TaxID=1485 RepID=UPI00293DF7EA|nr:MULTISPECIES: hypothetical protein [unclassified Clostridium]MDV4151799.1 hypothetical protein [Clostridium sp. AL.422]
MDRKLIEKIIGKKNYVDLNDEIYNLREVTAEMREKIVFKEIFKEDLLDYINNKALKSKTIIDNIIEGLENDKFAQGYTNSKIYLLKYLKDYQYNLNGILETINPLNYDELIIYTNSLIDLILLF